MGHVNFINLPYLELLILGDDGRGADDRNA